MSFLSNWRRNILPDRHATRGFKCGALLGACMKPETEVPAKLQGYDAGRPTFPSNMSLHVCTLYIYTMHMYVCMYVCMYVYLCIYQYRTTPCIVPKTSSSTKLRPLQLCADCVPSLTSRGGTVWELSSDIAVKGRCAIHERKCGWPLFWGHKTIHDGLYWFAAASSYGSFQTSRPLLRTQQTIELRGLTRVPTAQVPKPPIACRAEPQYTIVVIKVSGRRKSFLA